MPHTTTTSHPFAPCTAAGSFNITPRMQRHFATFAVQMPGPDIVRSIYAAILDGHLAAGGFDGDVTRLGARLVDATIELHRLGSARAGCWCGGCSGVGRERSTGSGAGCSHGWTGKACPAWFCTHWPSAGTRTCGVR